MSKVWGFVMFLGTLALGTMALAFVVRNFLPVSFRALFDFRGA